MIPIFFPFTHLRDQDLADLAFFFREIRYIHIPDTSIPGTGSFARSADSHGNRPELNRFSVDKTLMDRVMPMVQEYRDWAGLHSRHPGDLKALLRDAPYLKDKTGVAAIRSDITSKASSGAAAPPVRDPLEDALVFLLLAHESDMAAEAIDQELERLGRAEEEMVSLLKGEALPSREAPRQGDRKPEYGMDDPGSRMTEKRVLSWAKLFGSLEFESHGAKTPILVTTSPGVFDFVLSGSEKCRKILDITDFKVHERKYKDRPGWIIDFKKALKGAVVGDTQALELLKRSDIGGDAPSPTVSLALVTGGIIDRMFPSPEGKGGMDEWIRSHGGSVPLCLIRTGE